ncbi:hypothetical protein T439DRAFT_349444 [Meredithblackwellia eburnea MCA 4105]
MSSRFQNRHLRTLNVFGQATSPFQKELSPSLSDGEVEEYLYYMTGKKGHTPGMSSGAVSKPGRNDPSHHSLVVRPRQTAALEEVVTGKNTNEELKNIGHCLATNIWGTLDEISHEDCEKSFKMVEKEFKDLKNPEERDLVAQHIREYATHLSSLNLRDNRNLCQTLVEYKDLTKHEQFTIDKMSHTMQTFFLIVRPAFLDMWIQEVNLAKIEHVKDGEPQYYIDLVRVSIFQSFEAWEKTLALMGVTTFSHGNSSYDVSRKLENDKHDCISGLRWVCEEDACNDRYLVNFLYRLSNTGYSDKSAQFIKSCLAATTRLVTDDDFKLAWGKTIENWPKSNNYKEIYNQKLGDISLVLNNLFMDRATKGKLISLIEKICEIRNELLPVGLEGEDRTWIFRMAFCRYCWENTFEDS